MRGRLALCHIVGYLFISSKGPKCMYHNVRLARNASAKTCLWNRLFRGRLSF